MSNTPTTSPPSDALEELTIAAAHQAFVAGTLTVREVVLGYLERIETLDRNGAELNSVITVSETAIKQAERLDAHFADTGALIGPLHGVPVLVKDQVETADMTTTFGSGASGDYRPAADANAIVRLRQAGAIILGKTTMPDFATSWFSTSSRSGLTKNPYDLDRDPGGSSSGSAAAVAANLALVGIGEDTGGSVRLPASFCGLVGVRVTTGLISRAGMSPLVTTQDTAGPLTRTVADAAALLDVLVGFDAGDSYTAAAVIESGRTSFADSAAGATVAGKRIGVLRQAFPDDSDPDGVMVGEVVQAALDALAGQGVDLVDVAIDDLDEQVGFTSLYTTRSQADMDAFVASRPELGIASMRYLVDGGHHHDRLDLLEAIVAGPTTPTDDEHYIDRVLAQSAFQRQVIAVMAQHGLDAIAFPDAKLPAPTHADILAGRWTCLTYPTNTVIASQLVFPAVTVPAGLTTTGLPVGLELMGVPYSDRALVGLASAVEGALQARRASGIDLTAPVR